MSTPLQRYIAQAKAAGCPRDQIERFLSIAYCAHPKQLEFHALARQADEPDGPEEIFFGGARGPGKTYGTLAQCVDDCLRFPGLKILFLRKIGRKAEESMDDVRRKLLRATPHRSVQGVIYFINDSRIVAGHYDHDSDIDAYIGVEYDVIVIEEAGTIRENLHNAIRGSLRTSKPGWRPRLYLTSNPGGVSHAYLKRRFVTPYKRNKVNPLYRFVPARVHDNPYVDADYRGRLERLTGWRRRAWLEGDWEIGAGQFFTNFREKVHVIRPTQVVLGRHKWISLDHGYHHPTAVTLWTKEEGYSYVVDEYVQRFALAGQHAQGIRDMLKRHLIELEDLDACVAGHDLFSKTQQRGTSLVTIADLYAEHGIVWERADNSREQGAAVLLDLLGDVDNNIDPKLFFSERCVRSIEQMQDMVHDPKRPTDVLKVDINEDGEGGDDLYDCNRYAAMKGAELGVVAVAGYAPTQAPGYVPR